MIENLRLARRFYSLVTILLSTFLFTMLHLGFVVDIPYVPTLLLFKLPAFLVISGIYVITMVTLWNVEISRKIVRAHVDDGERYEEVDKENYGNKVVREPLLGMKGK